MQKETLTNISIYSLKPYILIFYSEYWYVDLFPSSTSTSIEIKMIQTWKEILKTVMKIRA